MHSAPIIKAQGGAKSKDDSTLVYTSRPPNPEELLYLGTVLRLEPIQLKHSRWTPLALRRLARSRLYGDHPARVIQSRLRHAYLARWARGVAENEPHAVEAWHGIVDAWLHGGDPVAVAERFFLGRRWAFELVSRFLAAASFYAFSDDLRAGICRMTHPGNGGRTNDAPSQAAETCSACILLAGADWEGWIAVEEAQ